MDLGSAFGLIEIAYNGAGVAQAKQALGELGDSGNLLDQQLGTIGKTAGLMGGALSAPLIKGVKMAADFEYGVDGVNAALGGVDTETLGLLSDQALELGASSKYSAGEVLGVQNELAKSGIAAEQLLGGATKAVLDLGAATEEGLGTATTALAGVVNMFGLSEEEITGVADTFTAGLNASSMSLDDYVAGLNYLGPVMANMNKYAEDQVGAFEDASAAIAYFNAQGLKGANAGVSLARGIQNLADPTSEATALMNELGISAFDAQGNFVGFPDLFDQLNASMSGMSDAQRESALSTIFGAQAVDVMNLAVKNGGDGLRQYEADMVASGQAALAAATRQDNLASAVEQLGGALESAGIVIGSTLIEPIRFAAEALTSLIEVFLGLPAPIQNAIGQTAGLVAGLLTVGGGAAFTASKIIGLASSFASVGLSLGAFATGIGIAIAAIAALALAYNTNFLGLKDAVDGALSAASKTMKTFGDRFGASFNARKAQGANDVAAAIGAVGDALKVATGIDLLGFTEPLAAGVQAVGDAFQKALDLGLNPFATGLSAVAAAAGALGLEDIQNQLVAMAGDAQRFGKTFGSIFSAGLATGTNSFSAALRALGGALSELIGIDVSGPFNALAKTLENLGNIAGQVGHILQDGLGAALGLLTNNLLPGVASGLGNVLGTIRDVGAELLRGDFSQAGQILGDALGSLGEWAGNVVQAVGDALGNLGGLIGQIDFGAIAQTVGNALGSALSAVGDFLGGINWSGVLSAIGTTLQAALSGIGSFLTNAAATLGSALSTALSAIGQFLGGLNFADVVQTVSDTLVNAFNAAGDVLGTVAATLGSALTTALGRIGDYLGGLSFKDLVSKVTDLISSAFGGGGGQLSGSGDFTGGGNTFAGVAQSVGSALGAALSTIGDYLDTFDPAAAMAGIKDKIESAINAIADFDFATLGDNIRAGLEAACGTDLSGVFDTLGQAISGVTTGLSSLAMAIGGYIADIKAKLAEIDVPQPLKDLASTFETLKAALGEDIGTKITEIGTAIAGFSPNLDGLNNLASALGKVKDALATEIGTKLGDIGEAISKLDIDLTDLQGLATALGGIKDALATDIGAGIKAIGQALSGLSLDGIAGLVQGIADAFNNLKEAITGLGGVLKEALGAGVQGAADQAVKPYTDMLGTLKEGLDQALGVEGNGDILNSDQGKAAAAQAGDFATNYIAAVAESFTTADWSPVTNAIDTSLAGALAGGGGGNGTGSGALEANGGNGASGSGAAIAQTFVAGIAAAFTPEMFAPVKAAFDAALAGAFADAGGESASGQQVATSLITGIASALGTQVDPLKAALQAVVQAAGAGIETSGLQSVGQQIVAGIAQGLGPATGTLTSALNAVISAAVAAANATAATANTVGTALMTAVGAGIGAGTGTVISAVQAMMTAAISAGSAAAAAASEIGTALATAAGSGIGSGTGTLISAVQAMVQSAIAAGVAAAGAASEIGAAISSGAAAGVNVHALDAAVAQMVSNGIAAGKAAMESASPSKVAERELGEPIPQGVAQGIAGETPLVENAAASMVTSAMDAARPYLEQAADLFGQYGLTFGATMATGMAQGIGGAAGQAAAGLQDLESRLRANADALQANLQRARDSFLPQLEGMLDQRNRHAAELQRDMTIETTGTVVMDGRAMGDFVVQTSLAPLTKVRNRGGGRASRFEGAGR